MRKRFELQYELGTTPIEKVDIPTRSRDELPPVLRALQYIYTTPEINEQVFDILEEKILSGVNNRMGCIGMSLWEILVLAVVRLTLDADYDRLEDTANYHILVRALLGISTFGENPKRYPLQTLKDNVGLLDDETIERINEVVVKSGHRLVKKNDEAEINVKVDSYVLESNVHFPTDLNLLWDAGRKCLVLIGDLIAGEPASGWRKYKYWRGQLKKCFRAASRIMTRGGRHREVRLQESVLGYLSVAGELSFRIKANRSELERFASTSVVKAYKYKELRYFEAMLDKHISLVRRRVIFKEEIPHEEKLFSLFEPYTRWVNKGKSGGRIELGLPVVICSDQYGFILHHVVMETETDVEMAIPLAKRILAFGNIASISYDKGFWSPENWRSLAPIVKHLIMPKKGRVKKSPAEWESSKTFVKLRRGHSAVESDINCLEHHGLNRCPDRSLPHVKRYASLGILALNLHRLGNVLLEGDRKAQLRVRAA